MSRPALLITSNHNLQSIWPKLYEHWDLCIAGQTGVSPQDLGLTDSFSLAKYNSAEVGETATNAAYEVAAKLHSPETSASICSRILEKFDGNCPDELGPEILKRWWPAMMGEHIKQGMTLVSLLKSLLAEREVSACVVHEDVTHDMRVMVQYCQSRNIPTFHIPHANCMYTGKEWDIHTESISDWILAGGTFAKEFYAGRGYPENNIRVTGMPQLDSWYGSNPLSKKEARSVLGIGENEFLVIYASSWGQLTSARGEFNNEFEKSIELVTNTAKEMRATLCIKMHPGEAENQEQAYLQKMKAKDINGFVVRHYNEYVLGAGDVLVAHGPSNICLQAAIIGLPSCYIPTEGFDFPSGPIRVESNIQSAIEIARTQSKDYWDEFAHKMNDSHPDGNACQRVADAILDAIQ